MLKLTKKQQEFIIGALKILNDKAYEDKLIYFEEEMRDELRKIDKSLVLGIDKNNEYIVAVGKEIIFTNNSEVKGLTEGDIKEIIKEERFMKFDELLDKYNAYQDSEKIVRARNSDGVVGIGQFTGKEIIIRPGDSYLDIITNNTYQGEKICGRSTGVFHNKCKDCKIKDKHVLDCLYINNKGMTTPYEDVVKNCKCIKLLDKEFEFKGVSKDKIGIRLSSIGCGLRCTTCGYGVDVAFNKITNKIEELLN